MKTKIVTVLGILILSVSCVSLKEKPIRLTSVCTITLPGTMIMVQHTRSKKECDRMGVLAMTIGLPEMPGVCEFDIKGVKFYVTHTESEKHCARIAKMFRDIHNK